MLKTKQLQQIKIPNEDTKTKSREVEDQNKKLESKDHITYTTESTEQNNRKYSTGKNEINNRVQNVAEIIEDKVQLEMANIQTKTKQEDNDIAANKTLNYQQQKKQQLLDKGKKKWKNQSIVIVNSKAKTTRPIDFISTSARVKIELERARKKTI